MKIYPKKLRSIEDLERERKSLLSEKRRLEKEKFFSVGNIMGGKDSEGKEAGTDYLGLITSFLPLSSPIVGTLFKLVRKQFSGASEKEQDSYTPGKAEGSKGKSVLKKVAVEVLGGYLKWKAVELTFKGVRHIIKSRKKKEE